MNNAAGIFALGVLLSGCFSARMQPQETAMALHPKQAKVYILSALPSDSTGTFMSTLIVQDTNNHVSAFVYSMSRSSATNARYSADSILSFDPATFPVIVQSAYPDSVRPSFRFWLDRDDLTFTSADPAMRYTFTYPKQHPFSINAAATDFRICSAEPFAATLEELNGQVLNESSTLALHILDNSTPLFGQKARQHFYWLDCRINDSLTHSLFLATRASGQTTIIYTTFPPLKKVEITAPDDGSDLTVALQLINGTIQISPVRNQELPSGRSLFYWVGAVELTQKGIPIGTGILYKL